jgi:hypothetical protein
VPPAQAQSQAQAQVKPKLDKQLDQIDQQTKAKRKKLDQTATDPRLQDLKTDITKTAGVKSVSEPLVNSDGTAAVLNATRPRRRRIARPPTWSSGCATARFRRPPPART